MKIHSILIAIQRTEFSIETFITIDKNGVKLPYDNNDNPTWSLEDLEVILLLARTFKNAK